MINPKQLNGGALAFIGDGVMTLKVREYLINQGYTKSKQLQEKSVDYVSAKAQSNFMIKILDLLDETEKDIYKRGRNFKSNTIPKNADSTQYHIATGLETLWGYWYLNGDHDRINEIFALMTKEK